MPPHRPPAPLPAGMPLRQQNSKIITPVGQRGARGTRGEARARKNFASTPASRAAAAAEPLRSLPASRPQQHTPEAGRVGTPCPGREKRLKVVASRARHRCKPCQTSTSGHGAREDGEDWPRPSRAAPPPPNCPLAGSAQRAARQGSLSKLDRTCETVFLHTIFPILVIDGICMNLHFSGWLAMENSCSEGGKCAWRRLLRRDGTTRSPVHYHREVMFWDRCAPRPVRSAPLRETSPSFRRRGAREVSRFPGGVAARRVSRSRLPCVQILQNSGQIVPRVSAAPESDVWVDALVQNFR